MFKKLNISNSNGFDKSNFNLLKIITVVLAILILVCLILLVIGFIKNYEALSQKNNKQKVSNETATINFFQPKNSQLISSSLGNNNQLLLRYQSRGNNLILIIDLDNKIILKKIEIADGKEWKIQ